MKNCYLTPAGDKLKKDNIKVPVSNISNLIDPSPTIQWCENYPSDLLFSYSYLDSEFYFESEQDAIMFSLTWSGK